MNSPDNKLKAAVSHVSRASGVDEAMVEKVLVHLGLADALKHNPDAAPDKLKVAANPILQ